MLIIIYSFSENISIFIRFMLWLKRNSLLYSFEAPGTVYKIYKN